VAKTPILVFDIVAFAGRQINVIDDMRDNETAHDDCRSNERFG